MVEKKKNRNRKLHLKTKQVTEKYMSYMVKKMKIDILLQGFLLWAENNRKKMFVINLTFLFGIVVFSLFQRTRKENFSYVYSSVKEVTNIDSAAVLTNIDEREGLITNQIEQMLTLQKYKNEISEIHADGVITKEDSIRLKEIYLLIKNDDEARED